MRFQSHLFYAAGGRSSGVSRPIITVEDLHTPSSHLIRPLGAQPFPDYPVYLSLSSHAVGRPTFTSDPLSALLSLLSRLKYRADRIVTSSSRCRASSFSCNLLFSTPPSRFIPPRAQSRAITLMIMGPLELLQLLPPYGRVRGWWSHGSRV